MKVKVASCSSNPYQPYLQKKINMPLKRTHKGTSFTFPTRFVSIHVLNIVYLCFPQFAHPWPCSTLNQHSGQSICKGITICKIWSHDATLYNATCYIDIRWYTLSSSLDHWKQVAPPPWLRKVWVPVLVNGIVNSPSNTKWWTTSTSTKPIGGSHV